MNTLKKLILILMLVFIPYNFSNAAERFSVDIQNVPVKEAILGLGYRADTNIVVNGELNGSVSLNLSNKTIYEILDLMALTHGFSYQIKDNTILVSTDKAMSTIKAYTLKHINLDKASKQLGLMLHKEKVFVNANDSTITIDGTSAQHEKASEYLQSLDKPIQQIVIRAAFIEINRDKGMDTGFDFSVGAYSGDPIKNLAYSITPNIQDTKGLGKMLARPSVVTANGEEAKILMGDKVPVFTSTNTSTTPGTENTGTMSVEYKDVGVTLKVTPRINDLEKGIVTLTLAPEVSTIAKWIQSGNNTAPQIATRTLTNQVRLKSGETIIIGGLFREEEIENIIAIPFLNKLPILGNLFKHIKKDKRKTEIAIAITPQIIKDIDGEPQLSTPDIINTQTPRDPYIKEEFSKAKNEIEAIKKELAEKEKELKVLKAKSEIDAAIIDAKNSELERSNKINTQNVQEKESLAKDIEMLKDKEKSFEKTIAELIKADYESRLQDEVL